MLCATFALMKKLRIVVGMSGGVDSSVAALLLKNQGHDVVGLFMKNWEEQESAGACTASGDFADMAQVCKQLEIESHQVNLSKEYWESVFCQFLKDCKKGLTPNPDILCNREIKFKAFMDQALGLGADFVATGHYCQIDHTLAYPRLKKALDSGKDQTYFLLAVKEKALAKTLFPIGHLHKTQVRAMAQRAGLHTHAKKDSTGICFVGKRPFSTLITDYIDCKGGPIEALDGARVGEHQGLALYTIGQRRGLGLEGDGRPWFVVAKDFSSNTLFVDRGHDPPSLYTQHLMAAEITWINAVDGQRFLPGKHYRLQCKIRYRQQTQECVMAITPGGETEVFFPSPQRAVTPGQYVCFYENDICLGGAKIVQKKDTFPLNRETITRSGQSPWSGATRP